MKELEKGTILITYDFFFEDKEQELFTKATLKSGREIATDESLLNYQKEFMNALKDFGNFVPVSEERYLRETEEEE